VQQARQRFADLCRELDAVEPSAAAPSGPSAAAPPSTAPSVRQQVSSLAAGAAVTIQLPGSAHKVASQREALLQQRRALAMERLWTIQCIKSREHVRKPRPFCPRPSFQPFFSFHFLFPTLF
jgi:hypothetical protein